MAEEGDVATMNYMALKKWVVTQGIAQVDANACPGKQELLVLCDKRGLTPKIAPMMLNKLKSVFRRVDLDDSGQIDASELCEILKGFFKGAAVDMVQKQVVKLIDTYDKNQNGVLEFPEFVEMVHYGDFWERFNFQMPVVTQEAVVTLAKGGTVEAPEAPKTTEEAVDKAEEEQAAAEADAAAAAAQKAEAEEKARAASLQAEEEAYQAKAAQEASAQAEKEAAEAAAAADQEAAEAAAAAAAADEAEAALEAAKEGGSEEQIAAAEQAAEVAAEVAAEEAAEAAAAADVAEEQKAEAAEAAEEAVEAAENVAEVAEQAAEVVAEVTAEAAEVLETQEGAADEAKVNCCDAFPEGYKDITPKEHNNGPEYLKGCKLVLMTLKKGEKDVPHYHPAHYMYILKGGKVRIVGAPAPPGETIEPELPTGAGMVMPAGEHVVENIGDDDIEVLFLEVGEQAGETPENHVAPQETNCDHYKNLAEDDDWMVVKMDIKAGGEDYPHSHREHVVYALSECELSIWGDAEGKGKEMTTDRDPDLKIPVKPGMVLPVPTGFHVVKNTGSTDSSMVYFERKR